MSGAFVTGRSLTMKRRTHALDPTIRMMVDLSSDVWCFKNTLSVILDYSETWHQLAGFKKSQSAVGLSDFDIPSKLSNCAALFQKQDSYVSKTLNPLKLLNIHPGAND